MKKKSLTLLLPSLLSGCTAFNATPVPDTTPPALVFVDGQIRESAAIIAHTQKRLLPPPVTRPVTPPRPTTTATPTTAVSSQSTALPPRPLLQATQLPALVMTGKPGQSSVVYLREAHQRSVSDWIRQLLPPGWQFRQQNAAIPALNKRLPVWSVNDQWHRALNALLAGQQLYGHMDWNRKILTVTTSATPPVDVTAPQGSQKAADTPRNPFRGSAATPAGPTPVTPAVSVSRAQTTTGTSGTPESRTTTPAPVAETGSATTAEGHTATAVENGKGDHPERRTGPLDIIRKMPARHMDTALGNTCQLQHRCPSGFHRQFPPGAGAALCTLYPG